MYKKQQMDQIATEYVTETLENVVQEEKTEGTQKEENCRECICGAKIPEGQFMCMECGRKIED